MIGNKILFIVVLIIACTIFFFSFQAKSNTNDVFCLTKSYNLYKKIFMSKDGRIIDYEKGAITTSEGQSYIMLRSLLIDDKQTFDLAYTWAKNNLQREDSLFAWLWGRNSDGKYKIIDENTASDADVDIAFALFSAYEKWKSYSYLEEGKKVVNAIWAKETKRVGNYLVLMPGVKQTEDEEKIEINPSYFSPYAFRVFQKYDELHNWELLVDSSYYFLDKVCFATNTNLPPNWALIKNNKIVLEESPKSDFSYDAIRVFARVYLDYEMTKDSRALSILEKTNFFLDKYKSEGEFYTNYKANGQVIEKEIFTGSISVLVPVIALFDKNSAQKIYKQNLEPIVENKNYWASKKDYYGKNITWFGLYFYEDYLKGCDIE